MVYFLKRLLSFGMLGCLIVSALCYMAGVLTYWAWGSWFAALGSANLFGHYLFPNMILPVSLTGGESIRLLSQEGFAIIRGPLFVAVLGFGMLLPRTGMVACQLWAVGYVSTAYGLSLGSYGAYTGYYDFLGSNLYYAMQGMVLAAGAFCLGRRAPSRLPVEETHLHYRRGKPVLEIAAGRPGFFARRSQRRAAMREAKRLARLEAFPGLLVHRDLKGVPPLGAAYDGMLELTMPLAA